MSRTRDRRHRQPVWYNRRTQQKGRVCDTVGRMVQRAAISSARESQPLARPFIKWAGGKSQLIPELARRLPPRFRRCHEPFVGGGALFFHLFNHGLLRDGAVLSDYNPELMVCYEVIRDDVESLITALRWHHRHRLDPHYFLEVRNWDRQPDFAQRSKIERAARTIFLNRTCYNGLYRLNRKGQFNAPFGYYKNSLICDPENLRLVSAGDFSDVLHRAEPGDLVYFDPPMCR